MVTANRPTYIPWWQKPTDRAGWRRETGRHPTTPTPVHATVTVPGSKSQTNRALVLAALATGPATSTISGALRSRDTDLMIGAVRALGVTVDGTGSELTVSGRIARPRRPGGLRAGRHGAALRPAGGRVGHRRCGSTATSRPASGPWAPLLDALRGWVRASTATACRSRCTAADRCRRQRRDRRVGVVAVRLRAPALRCRVHDGLTIVHTGESVPSVPHIAMTVSMLRDAGVDVDDAQANRWRVAPGPIAARHWTIEPDLSNAVPFLAAAAVSGGEGRG